MVQDDAFVSFLLGQKLELFREIYLFNNDLLSYIDPSFFPIEVPLLLENCRNLPDDNLRREWNILLKKSFRIEDKGEYNFSEKFLFLFLFSAQEIEKIIYCAGGICFAEAIRKVVMRNELLTLKKVMGSDIHNFAVRSGVLMLSSRIAQVMRCEGNSLEESIFYTGKSIVSSVLSRAPKTLLQRFILKFPTNYQWDFVETQNLEIQFRLVQKIVQNIFKGTHHAAMVEVRG